MKVRSLFLLIVTFLLLTSCATEAEKKEKRKNKLTESIHKDNGKILFDTSDVMYYVTKDGFYAVDYNNNKPVPIQFYTNLDSLNIREYTITITPTNVDVKTINQNYKDFTDPQITKADIINLFNSNNKSELFKIEYPWIIIGRDFIANIANPYNLVKVSNLKDRHNNIFPTSTSIANSSFTKGKGEISIEKKFNITDSLYYGDVIISFFNDSLKIQDLPKFSEYGTENIPQTTWNNGYYNYEMMVYPFYEMGLDTKDLEFQYKDEAFPKMEIKLTDDNKEITDNTLKWGILNIPIENWNKGNFYDFYNQREKQINNELEKFRNKIEKQYDDAVEKRRKEQEEAQKREIERIKKEAINITKITETYHSNSYKGEQLYPKNKYFFIKTKLYTLGKGSNMWKDEYRFGIEGERDDNWSDSWIYSDDPDFLQLDYPTKNEVIIRARFDGYTAGHPSFVNAELILW